MFPNPQAALPLPPRPNLEQYKKLAKDLVKACKSSDHDAIGTWAEKWIERLARLQGAKITPKLRRRMDREIDQVEEFARRKLSPGAQLANKTGTERIAKTKVSTCALTNAQFVIALSHGFESWPKLAKHIEGLARPNSPVSEFESAADAIVTGEVATLKRLLREDPELIRARSTREHRATLLHYVSANGVEGYRQKTPKNAVQVAEILLDAGAEVDAEADVYGGGATTLGLVATSVHPFRAGVQNPLIQILLDHGAQIDYPEGAGNGQGAVMGCLANGRGEAAVYLAERGARLNLEAAAGVGRLDVVKTFFNPDGSLKANCTKAQMESAFQYACREGHISVVDFFLQKGLDVRTHSGDGQTALHWAAIGGKLEMIKFLLKQKNASLEVTNMYGGTVLGQTLWSAAHGGDADVYIPIIETLIAAGARIPDRHPPINRRVDELLERHGSHAHESWWWYGEKPRERRVK